MRRRAEGLLRKARAEPWTADDTRVVRAVEALERSGTAGARAHLDALAAGAPGVLSTEEARAVLARLAGAKGGRGTPPS